MATSASSSVYNAAACLFATRVREMFRSEDALQKAYAKHFPHFAYDRTERWHALLSKELRSAWNTLVPGSLTRFDEAALLRHVSFEIDYNLFTQVLLNLQPGHLLHYRVGEAMDGVLEIRDKWAERERSPYAPKAKMVKEAAGAEDLEFNRDLSTLKALRIVQGLSFARSFRVSPMGATPALADSENLSMLGIGGDPLLLPTPGSTAFYFCWDKAPELLHEVEGDPGSFATIGIPYTFQSRSGGDILNGVLFSRWLATLCFRTVTDGGNKAVLPRMSSVLLVTDAPTCDIDAIMHELDARYPGVVRLHVGQRPDPELPQAGSARS